MLFLEGIQQGQRKRLDEQRCRSKSAMSHYVMCRLQRIMMLAQGLVKHIMPTIFVYVTLGFNEMGIC